MPEIHRTQAHHPDGVLARGTLWLAFGFWVLGIGCSVALWLALGAPSTQPWRLGMLSVCGGLTLPVLTAGRWAWRTRPTPVVLDGDRLSIGPQRYTLSGPEQIRWAVAHLGAFELTDDLRIPLQLRLARDHGAILPPIDLWRTLAFLRDPEPEAASPPADGSPSASDADEEPGADPDVDVSLEAEAEVQV